MTRKERRRSEKQEKKDKHLAFFQSRTKAAQEAYKMQRQKVAKKGKKVVKSGETKPG